MNWACGGPNSGITANSSNKSGGIPPEFHDHLKRRRQLLWEAREKATNVMKVSLSILEFEASRDGIFCNPVEISPFRTSGDGRAWQQAYLNALTRLEVAFHSFSRAEQEWKLAQSSVEAASNGLFSASNELSAVSLKAKSASGDLQSTLLQMRDCAYEASVALSSFALVVKGHTALTSECGSMLEEVLAITDGLHDVHNLGKEAATVHRSLMECISKACEIIFPLESILSKDVTAMSDAMGKERETKMDISPIHGQAIYQSYSLRIKEALQTFKPLVLPLMSFVKELYSLLTKLAQSASVHAGDLHKAVEGVEGSLEAKSQEIDLSSDDLVDHVREYGRLNENLLGESDGEKDESSVGVTLLPTQDKGWISPPDSMYSTSSEIGSTSDGASPPSGLSFQGAMEQLSINSNHEEAEGHAELLLFRADLQGNLHSGLSQSKEMEGNHCGVDPSFDIQQNVPAEGIELPNELSASSPPHVVKAEKSEVNLEGGDDETSSNRVGAVGDGQNGRPLSKDRARTIRGKNAFAMSVLRRIEMKLDGRDIAENREISIGEQVDYLLKQATSTDNLCNMYEGWTPWI